MTKEEVKLSMMDEGQRAIYLAKKMDKKPLKSDFAQSFFESMRGEDGIDGADGKDGIDGKDGVNGTDGIDGKDGKNGLNGKNGKDGVNGIDGKDGKQGPKGEVDNQLTIDSVIKELKKKQYLEPKDIKGMPINMNDMRWHGGGLSNISHDATLTGTGTPASPLSVVPDAGSKYVQLFNATTDWGAAVGGYYTITVLVGTHGHGTSPLVQFYESDGGTGFYQTIPDQSAVNAVGDVAFRVTDIPDLRFAGKIIIM